MVDVPNLNRLSRLDAPKGVAPDDWQRQMYLWDELCTQIEGAFGGVNEALDYVAMGMNPDGTIKADKVLNESVVAGAVIAADAAYNNTSTDIKSSTSGPYNTYVNVATKPFTSTGNEVQIAIAARIQVHDNCKIIYRLLCDGVQVQDEIGPVSINLGDQVPLSFIWAHTPSAGDHDYDLEVQVNNNGITVHSPLISPSENRNF